MITFVDELSGFAGMLACFSKKNCVIFLQLLYVHDVYYLSNQYPILGFIRRKDHHN